MSKPLFGLKAMKYIASLLRIKATCARRVTPVVNSRKKEEYIMFGFVRVAIGDGERGLLYQNRRFERVLGPGVYRLWDPLARLELRTFDIARPEYEGKDGDVLVERLGAALARDFVLADIGTGEVGLVAKNGKLEDVLAPGSRKLYWKGVVAVSVEQLPARAWRCRPRWPSGCASSACWSASRWR